MKITRDNVPSLPTDVWLYPANNRHCGSVAQAQLVRFDQWNYFVRFLKDPQRLRQLSWTYHNRIGIYSSLEAAKAARAADKAEPKWLYRGKFSINVLSVPAYLSHLTGIPEQNIYCHSTPSYLHVVWVNGSGLRHERLRNWRNEVHFLPLIEQMKGLKR